MTRFTPNNRKPRSREWQRMTISHLGTTNSNVVGESGFPIDERDNAGPMVLDYSAMMANYGPGNPGFGDHDLSDADQLSVTKYLNREYTWVLCDGRAMGPGQTEDFPGGASNNISFREWEDCEYAVLRNIRWHMVIATPRPENAYLYYRRTTDNDDHDAPGSVSTVDFPMDGDENTLRTWIDQMTIGGVEAEGGDFWWQYCEALLCPISVTLLRCEVKQADELTTDITLDDTDQPRSTLMRAPLGMMLQEELDDISAYYGADSFDPTTDHCFPVYRDLQGVPRRNVNTAADLALFNPTDTMYDRQYRAWEPYDDTPGILDRRFMFERFRATANQSAASRWELDVDGLEAFEPVGTTTMPNWTTSPPVINIHGSFKGEVVVSTRNPAPLVLHLASLPVCLNSLVPDEDPLGLGVLQTFYRTVLSPISWIITADVKIGG